MFQFSYQWALSAAQTWGCQARCTTQHKAICCNVGETAGHVSRGRCWTREHVTLMKPLRRFNKWIILSSWALSLLPRAVCGQYIDLCDNNSFPPCDSSVWQPAWQCDSVWHSSHRRKLHMTRPRTLAVTTDTQIVDNTIYTEPAISFWFILYSVSNRFCLSIFNSQLWLG